MDGDGEVVIELLPVLWKWIVVKRFITLVLGGIPDDVRACGGRTATPIIRLIMSNIFNSYSFPSSSSS
jgi:hypothetical protein